MQTTAISALPPDTLNKLKCTIHHGRPAVRS